MKRGFAFWFGHLAALLLAAAMVITLPFAIAARDFGVVLFSPARMQSILQSRLIDSGLFDRLLEQSLFGEQGIRDRNEWYKRATEHLSEPERQELLRLLVPPGWIEEQISGLSHSIYEWFESDLTVPDLYLDIQPVKARLLGDSLDQAVEIFVDSWPSCSPGEVENLERAFEAGHELPSIVCEPPEPLRGYIVDLATRALANETEKMPDRTALINQAEFNFQELQSAKATLRRLEALLLWSWLVSVAALGPIMALKVRGLPGLGRWWGLPLFFSGVVALILNLIWRASREAWVNDLIAGLGSPDTVQYALAAAVVQSAVGQALRLMIIHAFIIMLIGAFAWFLLVRVKSTKPGRISGTNARAIESEEESDLGLPSFEQSPPPVPPIELRETDEQDEGPPSGIFG
jgi:hypothetical protein